MGFTPFLNANAPLGPGRARDVKVSITGGEAIGELFDAGNGTYMQLVQHRAGESPRVRASVGDVTSAEVVAGRAQGVPVYKTLTFLLAVALAIAIVAIIASRRRRRWRGGKRSSTSGAVSARALGPAPATQAESIKRWRGQARAATSRPASQPGRTIPVRTGAERRAPAAAARAARPLSRRPRRLKRSGGSSRPAADPAPPKAAARWSRTSSRHTATVTRATSLPHSAPASAIRRPVDRMIS